MKKLKNLVITGILLIFSTIVFTGCDNKSTEETLQDQSWDITNNNMVKTADFSESNKLKVSQNGAGYSYNYNIITNDDDQEYMEITGKGSLDEYIKYVYKINGTETGFNLILDEEKSNNNALNDTDDFVGNIQLDEK
ncbi:MAG: hypothetical protein L0I95_06410 [Tetragenococcus koreensis]|nr:hypothetical protein [Tetragenococcus koreensis]MDN6640713.1 hypothetical protein [Tetragenococcus sp.]MDN6145937.1 hypothetical protein [Tetragenococcus koreensis]MDN6165562.1 hypothetical protein [Tetragenococcus koreensis]MDN6270093.1 hypothetical protein [Tetragenococcus koreensis]